MSEMLERHIPDEADIKSIVLSHYRRSTPCWNQSIVASEFSLGFGSSARVDLAIVGDEFIGIEIKSERDTLKRLSHQVSTYSKFFDRVVVVAAERHLRNLDWSHLRVADVWKIDRSGRIKVVSHATAFSEVQCFSALLTHEQLKKHHLLDLALRDHEKCRTAFLSEFRSRFSETSSVFWANVSDREIQADDLRALSRFKEKREAMDAWAQDRTAKWHRWEKEITRLL